MTEKILHDYAMKFVGVPYKWGGDDPLLGIDCSGLVIELLQSQGVLPRGYDSTAKDLFKFFTKGKTVSDWATQPAQFGSLVFFGQTLEGITHIGFALSPKLMVEAGGGDSTVIDMASAAAKNAYVRVRPIHWRRDLVAVVTPIYPWEKT